MSIAPYQVHLIGLKLSEPAVAEACEKLYDELLKLGVEVLYDDRGEKAGSAFADADLLGIPLRIIVSPKTLEAGQVEYKHRDWGKRSEMRPIEGLATALQHEIRQALDESLQNASSPLP